MAKDTMSTLLPVPEKQVPWHEEECKNCVFCISTVCRRNPPVITSTVPKYPIVTYHGGAYFGACSKFAKR